MRFVIYFVSIIALFYAVTGMVYFLEKKGILKQGTLARGFGNDPATKKSDLKKVLLVFSSIGILIIISLLMVFGEKR